MSSSDYDKLQKQIDLWENYYTNNKILDKVHKSHYGENNGKFFRNLTKSTKR
jgi:hypothetical protein